MSSVIKVMVPIMPKVGDARDAMLSCDEDVIMAATVIAARMVVLYGHDRQKRSVVL